MKSFIWSLIVSFIYSTSSSENKWKKVEWMKVKGRRNRGQPKMNLETRKRQHLRKGNFFHQLHWSICDIFVIHILKRIPQSDYLAKQSHEFINAFLCYCKFSIAFLS